MSNEINQNYKDVVKDFNEVEAIITPTELKNIFAYIKNMEDNMSSLRKELDGLSAKLNAQGEISQGEKGSLKTMQETFSFDLVEKKEALLAEMQELMLELKTGIVEKAEEIRSCVHEKNLEGLNIIFSKLHVKEILEKMSNLLENAIEKSKNYIERIVYVENELGLAKGHLKNVKDPTMPATVNDEGVNMMAIKKAINTQRKLFVNMKDGTDTLSKNLNDLSKKVEVNISNRDEKRKEILGKSVRLPAHGNLPIALQR